MILGFCGESKSGKTTMISEILKKLANDYRIAVVKHTSHGVDLQGKDSRIFRNAGASEVVLIGEEIVRFQNSASLFSVLKSLSDYDIVLVEGFKKEKFLPKVCFGMRCDNCVLIDPTLDDVLKYIDTEMKVERILKKLPNFNCGECGHRNCEEMARAIYRGEDKFENCRYWNPNALISVKVNGKDIYMGKFAQDVVINTITGLLSSFKGVKEIKNVEIKIDLSSKVKENENI